MINKPMPMKKPGMKPMIPSKPTPGKSRFLSTKPGKGVNMTPSEGASPMRTGLNY